MKRTILLSTLALLAELISSTASAQTLRNPAPSVAQVGGSSVIAAVAVNGSLQFYWQTIGTSPWNPEQVAGPGTTKSASVAQVGNSSVIAAVDANGSLQFYWQTIGPQHGIKNRWPGRAPPSQRRWPKSETRL